MHSDKLFASFFAVVKHKHVVLLMVLLAMVVYTHDVAQLAARR